MKKVHFISIGGSVMHSLAIALKNTGYIITGSDDKLYEPSLSRLKSNGILPDKLGWYPSKIQSDLDFIILGMHAKVDNPELLTAQQLNLNILSYPEFIYNFSSNKTRIVIGGSHGKTTITSMILHVLRSNNIDVDFVLGAQLDGFTETVSLSKNNEFILIEGDEYLSSPIDNSPKFHKYKANIALLSGISWDHINVFPNPDIYNNQFSLFIETIVDGGVLVFNELDPQLNNIVEKDNSFIRKIRFGMPEYSTFNDIVSIETDEGNIPLRIFGKHNLSNLEGAKKICSLLGVFEDDFFNSISSFKGASNRLETLYNKSNNLVIKDFAHSPSKLKASILAVKETFLDKFVIGVYELHTFSSLNSDFINQYSGCLDSCDLPIVFFDNKNIKLDNMSSINNNSISNAFNINNLIILNDKDELLNYLLSMNYKKTCLLLMSSGNFDSMDLSKIINHIDNYHE